MNLHLTLLFLCISFIANAQFGKKTLKKIEKAARTIPADTFRIGHYSIDTERLADSQFGELIISPRQGWNAYRVNFKDGNTSFLPGLDFENKSPFNFIQVSHKEFGMSAFEVSNADYWDYVVWVQENHPENLENILPDSQAWQGLPGFYAPFVAYYHRHPAYNNYPVINIRHDQAVAYLEWLTDQYNRSNNRKYRKVLFRLPTEAEWMYAWLGGESINKVSNNGHFEDEKHQATANYYSPVPAQIIQMQWPDELNFSDTSKQLPYRRTQVLTTETDTFRIPQKAYPDYYTDRDNYHFADKKEVQITSPVDAYPPNGYGLYNMAGNVAEFVAMYGIVKGGHWNTSAYYLLPNSRELYSGWPDASPTRGFRWVMEIIEP